MAYSIDRYNKTLLTVVEDGTIDQTTDLKFIGKNYAGYGEFHNENFLFLLENFSGAQEPARPISGQVWFDSGSSKLKFYDGTKWRTTGGAEVSAAQPAGLAEGDFWWDSANDQLYVYNGTSFVLIGPQDAGDGVTQMVSQTIIDTNDNTRSIIVAFINDLPIFVISPNQFTIKNVAGNTLDGFDVIKQGITLRDTSGDTGITSSAYRHWGTASDADRLGGTVAAGYVTYANPNFTTQVTMTGGTLINDMRLATETAVGQPPRGIIEHSGPSSEVVMKAADNLQNITDSARFTSAGMMPGTADTSDIGGASNKFRTIYAGTFDGTALQSDKLKIGTSSYISASTSAVANTIVARTASNQIFADVFEGVATTAKYADLAENYSTAEELPVGTAVAVCSHEDHEVEPASAGQMVIGVVSEAPAYLMNSEADGQAIGLKGRVPVRVHGPVKKGQAVYAMKDGVCSTIAATAFVGIALESNDSADEKLVECVLK